MTRAAAPAERAPRPKKSNKPDRLRSAWKIVQAGGVGRIPDGTFHVAGNLQPYYEVDLRQAPACHCADMEYRGTSEDDFQCKHILAARLSIKDPSLLGTLIDMFVANEDGSTS